METGVVTACPRVVQLCCADHRTTPRRACRDAPEAVERRRRTPCLRGDHGHARARSDQPPRRLAEGAYNRCYVNSIRGQVWTTSSPLLAPHHSPEAWQGARLPVLIESSRSRRLPFWRTVSMARRIHRATVAI